MIINDEPYFCLAELIDTLWNVNKENMELKRYENIGINRYIMECK